MGCNAFEGLSPDPTDGGAGDGPSTSDGGRGSTYAAAVLKDSPDGYWRFEETSGDVAQNEIKGGATCALKNDATFEENGIVSSRALNVKGNGQNGPSVADCGDDIGFDTKSSFSIETWINPTSGGDFQQFYSHGTGAGDNRTGYIGYVQDNGLRFDTYDVGFACFVYGGEIQSSAYSHVVVTYGSGTLNMYVNGKFAGTAKCAKIPVPTSDGPFVLGGNSQINCCGFKGRIDEVAVYSKVLSDTQIQAHYDAANVGR